MRWIADALLSARNQPAITGLGSAIVSQSWLGLRKGCVLTTTVMSGSLSPSPSISPSQSFISQSSPPIPDPVLDDIRELVSSSYLNHDPSFVHLRAGALFARLKALNRAANAAARAHKHLTSNARNDMDQTHLLLQNLLYEKRHLEREIEKCRQFA